MLSLADALIASGVMAAIIIFCRALPFLFLAGRKPPAFLTFVEASMPAIAMTVLAVAAYTALDWSAPRGTLPQLIAGATVVLLHLWKRNALVSILGGTALYFLLEAIFAA
jgi:branched-subunit amino acid transport protein AzlD